MTGRCFLGSLSFRDGAWEVGFSWQICCLAWLDVIVNGWNLVSLFRNQLRPVSLSFFLSLIPRRQTYFLYIWLNGSLLARGAPVCLPFGVQSPSRVQERMSLFVIMIACSGIREWKLLVRNKRPSWGWSVWTASFRDMIMTHTERGIKRNMFGAFCSSTYCWLILGSFGKYLEVFSDICTFQIFEKKM